MPSNFDRRSFIKGLGVATGLAASFASSSVAMGQTQRAPLRVLLVGLQHGWGRDLELDRKFTGSEFDFTIPSPLTGFKEIQDQMVFVDGARGTFWANAHDVSYADMFTAGVYCNDAKTHGAFTTSQTPSLDHVLAKHANKPAFRINARYRSWGEKSHPLCFDDSGRRLDPYNDPRTAYDAIIDPIRGNAQAPMPGRDAKRQSLFEYLGRDTDRLLKKVSGSDRTKLEGYLQAVNAVSERLNQQSKVVVSLEDIPDRPTQSPAFDQMVDDYLEMIRLVFQADTHRVGVLGFGEGIDDWNWRDRDGSVKTGTPWKEGGPIADKEKAGNFHHYIAHHNPKDDHGELGRLAYDGWVGWYVKKIVKLVKALQATPDVDGNTLLDNTLILLTGEVGTGNHDTRNKLHTIIGGGDRLKRGPKGRWVQAPTVEPRKREGVFLGGMDRQGNKVENKVNYGAPLSAWHTGDVLTEIARIAGVPKPQIGLDINNSAVVPIKLSP